MGRMQLCNAMEGLSRTVQEIAASSSVDMKVHESRTDIQPFGVDDPGVGFPGQFFFGKDGGEMPVFQNEGGFPDSVGEEAPSVRDYCLFHDIQFSILWPWTAYQIR